MSSSETFRKRVYRELDPAARVGRGLSPVNLLLTFLILFAAATVILETEPTISAGHERQFDLVEDIIGGIFMFEYLVRLWIAVEIPRYASSKWPRLRYAVSLPAIIDLLAVLPTLLALSSGGSLVLRAFRLLRLLRLAKLGRTSLAWRHMSEAVYSRRYELGLTVGVLAVCVLIAGSLLYWAEADAQPDKFGSIPRALWWAIITLTTVGYGDVFPITTMGKVFAGMFAMVGVALIALPTGIFAASFSDALQKHREKQEQEQQQGPDA